MPESIKMPNSSVLLSKLTDSGLYKASGLDTDVYNKFIDLIADQTFEDVGKSMGATWDKALSIIPKTTPIQYKLILEMSYDLLVEALFEDLDIANSVKAARKNMRQILPKEI